MRRAAKAKAPADMEPPVTALFDKTTHLYCCRSCNGQGPGLASAVAVLQPDYIVLAEIAPGLHLDQVQRDLAWIFEPMRGADRDVGRLVLGQHHLLVAAADLRRALDDDPMLGPMMVH